MFMGQEFAQFIEWNFSQQLDWLLLDYETHQKFLGFTKALNHMYLDSPPLYEIEDSWDGFRWISNDDASQNVISFFRTDKNKNSILVVCNFSPVARKNYSIGAPKKGTYRLILNTESSAFGGSYDLQSEEYTTETIPLHGFPQSLNLTLPPLSTLYFKIPKKNTSAEGASNQ